MWKDYNGFNLIKRFIPYYSKYKGLFLGDMFEAILTIFAEICVPLIIRSIINIATEDIAQLTVKYILN